MPSDLNAATEDLGRRVRKVAESASEAAFGRTDDKINPNENTSTRFKLAQSKRNAPCMTADSET